MLIGNHEAVPLVLFVVISVHHEAEWSEYAWSCWAWLFGRWDRLLLGMWQNRFDRSLISVIFLLKIRNRPRSRWNLCGSLVEHQCAEAEGLRFDSSWELGIFFHIPKKTSWYTMQSNLAQHSHTLGTLGTLSVLRLRNRVSIGRDCSPPYWKLEQRGILSACAPLKFVRRVRHHFDILSALPRVFNWAIDTFL